MWASNCGARGDGLAAGDTRGGSGGDGARRLARDDGVPTLHVGAVAFGACAVVVVGAGGAGKSTATLAAALAGAEFLGDDVCAFDVDEESGSVSVHALFTTAKVNPDTDARLGLQRWPSLGTTPKGKRVVSVLPHVRVRCRPGGSDRRAVPAGSRA